jgi:hypothetical protein
MSTSNANKESWRPRNPVHVRNVVAVLAASLDPCCLARLRAALRASRMRADGHVVLAAKISIRHRGLLFLVDSTPASASFKCFNNKNVGVLVDYCSKVFLPFQILSFHYFLLENFCELP